MTAETVFTVTVPRQTFTGWFLAVGAFREAGLSDVIFTFRQGELTLLSYWGETRMNYEGAFEGVARIHPRRLLTLAKKGEKMMQQPIPVKLTLNPGRRVLGVDLSEVPAEIEVYALRSEAVSAPLYKPQAVGFIITAGELLGLVKEAWPSRTVKKEHVKFIASAVGVTIQTSRGLAKRAVFVLGGGSWTLSLEVILRTLQSYGAKETLIVETDANGMRINAFTMPVLGWERGN